MSNRYYLYPAWILMVFLSCSNPYQKNTNEAIRITSPRTDWVYYGGRSLQLTMNINSSDIEWYSSIEGYLGKGNGLLVNLWIGEHSIEAHYAGSIYSVTIDIQVDNVQYLEERRQLIVPKEVTVNLGIGKWFPALVTLEGTAGQLSYTTPFPRSMRSAASPRIQSGRQLRDFQVEGNIKGLKPITQKRRQLRAAVGDKKLFNVINTLKQYDQPHEILGELIYSGTRYTIWRDTYTGIDAAALSQCITNLNTIIMPRLLEIWGEWADVDGDGKIAIFFSPTINEEDAAIGFFNPQDFFLGDDENPFSNQADIIYVGYPQSSPSSSYTAAAVSATIAHELTHAITFSQKTYNKIAMGKENVSRETVFLDEGWSHLSENLCGFGLSGGNILFLNEFFKNTAEFSFCTPSVHGDTDSTGMRGAMCLFMSWLFWRQGGMEWDLANPGKLTDRGGISFLKDLVNLDQIGWNSIGTVIGTTMDELFLEFLYDLNRQRALGAAYTYKTDPHTAEPAEFSNNMGSIIYQGKTYNITILACVPPEKKIATPPWSFFFIDPLEVGEESIMKFYLEYCLGKVLFSTLKG